jgi:chromosome segregation ATPase
MTGILAKLFPGNTELAQLEASILEADTLRADLSTAQARIDELTPLSAEVSNLQSQLSEITAQLETAQARVAELEPQVEITNEKVETRAAEMLAAQGHPAPVSLVGDAGKTILEQFEELKGAEATAFYREHKKAIVAAQKQVS